VDMTDVSSYLRATGDGRPYICTITGVISNLRTNAVRPYVL